MALPQRVEQADLPRGLFHRGQFLQQGLGRARIGVLLQRASGVVGQMPVVGRHQPDEGRDRLARADSFQLQHEPVTNDIGHVGAIEIRDDHLRHRLAFRLGAGACGVRAHVLKHDLVVVAARHVVGRHQWHQVVDRFLIGLGQLRRVPHRRVGFAAQLLDQIGPILCLCTRG